jgi:hypothetical protein
MPGPCLDPDAAVDLRAALRAASLALYDLLRRRTRLATIAREHWRGGRRQAFDDALTRLDRETARLARDFDILARRFAAAAAEADSRACR